MHTPEKKYLGAITILGVTGMLVSLYLTYLHYNPSKNAFCNVNDYLNCDIVNKSKYADLGGIPVGVIGFLGYFLLTVMSHGWHKNWFKKPTHKKLMIFSSAGLAFSLYLTFIEFFVLNAVCALCVTSQIIIISIFILSIIIWIKFSE